VRNTTVRNLAQQLQIDQPHAARVCETAQRLLADVAEGWELTGEHAALLQWAGQLHEAGQFMSYSGYHKHGAYLLAHADLAGFTRQEQRSLAAIVLCHRGRLSWERLRTHMPGADHPLLRMAILMRLATTIHRTRSTKTPPAIRLSVRGVRLTVRYPEGWLAERPLTRADLADISRAMSAVGYTLAFR
ncbi:MAG: exopolyphosphatase/guanosine-5'-triphosphate,3'-diphosphate pyrophosphatase, partial [Myxococcota bacterium]